MDVTKIKKGDDLMIFDAEGHSIAFATSHTFTLTADNSEISCKDSGVWKNNLVTKMSWEIQSENLFSEEAYKDLFDAMVAGVNANTEFEVYFGVRGATSGGGAVAYGVESPDEYYTAGVSCLYKGKAYITSLVVNAASGDNATYSVTLTGNGKIEAVTQLPGA